MSAVSAAPDDRQAKRRERIADGLCVDCGQPRAGATSEDVRALKNAELLRGRVPYPLPHPPTATRCSACAGKHREGDIARRATLARAAGRTPRQPRPTNVLPPPPLRAVTTLRIPLNHPALAALSELKRRAREAALAARKGASDYPPGQVSRLVRETIARWQHRSGGYRRIPAFCQRGLNLHVRVDAATLATIDREARAHFGGSRSATVRAMLVSTVNPPITGATAGHRLSAQVW